MSRITELILVLILIVVTIPFMILTWAFVRLRLGKPVLFRQIRSGIDGKPITVLKFRSMTDARDAQGVLLPDRLRQNRATAFMRRLRLDELPQLWCILRGDMALVGPRPLLPQTIADFGSLGRMRCQVRPGLTGWAQVSGNTKLGDQEKLALDLWYVAHRSNRLDARILRETLSVALGGEVRDTARLATAQSWLMQGAAP